MGDQVKSRLQKVAAMLPHVLTGWHNHSTAGSDATDTHLIATLSTNNSRPEASSLVLVVTLVQLGYCQSIELLQSRV